MAISTLNVFRGPESVAQYFDPDYNPPLPLIEIPDRLNPLRGDNVRIYAKMLTCLPAQNVKSLPALHMLRNEPKARDLKIAEASSGSTILSLGIIARVLWGKEDVEAHVTNKKSPESLNLLRFFGIKPCLFGGLAQQEPTDPAGIMERLRRKAEERDDMVYLGQYHNDNNWKAHEAWTGPQILRQLPEINVFSTTVGTGGCIAGTGVYLKSQKPSTQVLGVFNVAGDPVPGPRYYEGFQSSPFPWQGTIDSRVEVTSASAYRLSMRLSREGLICGPSSGEALQGLLQYLIERKQSGTLGELVDEKTKEISCVFTCSDLPYQYLPAYFEKLGDEEFPSIENEILLQCDQDKHDLRWILNSRQAAALLNANSDAILEKDQELEITVQPCSTPRTDVTDEPTRRGGISRYLGGFCGFWRIRKQAPRLEKALPVQPQLLPMDSTMILDLRRDIDFKQGHVSASTSAPLSGLVPDLAGGDLFGDPNAVHMVWTQTQEWLRGSRLSKVLFSAARNQQRVLVVCYDGFASQIVCSALRKKGLEAFSVEGGFPALWGQFRRQENE
ncbi:cysteine synthase [Aaosphaeria arxii CBS 175.79]|uniref:Cysteine synthase n=1 Tax=Aaosphaeria arxii CBS 175.79 TaxID=1450172 RepID=A0A6A5Y4J5_9PLEO|nr:cysteine synthase [Aaosphaeria arxii CBS 175.79]KAF2019957.1 cysteine synthase [Aaosphaeria arxii CBS 175.79]